MLQMWNGKRSSSSTFFSLYQVSAFKKAQNGFRQTLKWLCDFFPILLFFSRICLSTITTSAHCVPSTILLSLPFHSLLLLCHRNILNTKDLMEIATFINSTNLCQRKLINMKSTAGVSARLLWDKDQNEEMSNSLFIFQDVLPQEKT